MRRLSGRIKQRTSLYLQSFMALCCLCSGGGGGRKEGRESAPCVAPEKHTSLSQHLALLLSCNYITFAPSQVTKHNQWVLHFENLSFTFVSSRLFWHLIGADCDRVQQQADCTATMLTLWRKKSMNDLKIQLPNVHMQQINVWQSEPRVC